jgi:ureidoacrylate peracid hydrolase
MSAPHATYLDGVLQPAHSALLVIDMQNDFCHPDGWMKRERNHDLSAIPALTANINRVVDAARAAGMPVVWIRAIYDFKYLTPAHIAKRVVEGCVMEGSWGADFCGVDPKPGEPVVDKHHFSGFHGTPLEAELQQRGIRTLVLAGVATNVCVESTLREGFFRGYHIVLLEDCVGSNSRAGHEGTLATVRNNIGTVMGSAELIGRLAAVPA